MNENEKYVLMTMLDNGREFFYSFAALGSERKVIRRACRSLARKGLTRFGKGLWNEDGEPVGSGYALTDEGAVEASILCTERDNAIEARNARRTA